MLHPTLVIFIFSVLLIFLRNKEKIFVSLSILMPIISSIFLYMIPMNRELNFLNSGLIQKVTFDTRLIATAFIIVLFCANLQALNRKNELIFGSLYCGCTIFCLFANDFISIFISLEMMMLFASIIIFIGNKRESARYAKQYFLTHFFSGSAIIFGIVYLISKNQSIELVNITELIHNPKYSLIPLYVMLCGILINIAIFPFSGWMNYYNHASDSGFLYLISFTTKVSITLLAKLFSGYIILQYAGAVMIIYSSLKASIEDDLMQFLCYLSIMSMGFMVIGISAGNSIISYIYQYLFIHIIYKLLLSLVVVNMRDINSFSSLQRINSKFLLVTLCIGISAMINLPIVSSFYIKSSISHFFVNNPIYLVIIFLSFMNVFVIPWGEYFNSRKNMNIKMNIYSKIAIFISCSALIIINFKIGEYGNILSKESLIQTIIIILAFTASIYLAIRRKKTKSLNLLELVGRLVLKFSRINSKKEREFVRIKTISDVMIDQFIAIYNRQNAITLIFIFLIMIFAILLNTI